MAIYTKTGDKGQTSLANGERISKADARIEAYGTVDELNSWIGLLRAALRAQEKEQLAQVDEQLKWLQNKLFNLGASLSMAPGEWIAASDVTQVEQWIDSMQQEVPKLHSFVLPSGGEAAARCHVCRTICRRAERKMIPLGSEEEELQFANRISDYLFVLARYLVFLLKEEEESWSRA